MFKALCRSSPEHARHLALSDLLSGRKEHRPLDDVIQLAYVSRPVIFHKPCFSAGRESLARQAEIVSALLEKVFRENRDVFSPLAERGYGDRHHVQPVIKVFAEFSLSHRLRKVPVGGGDQPDVHVQGLRPADTLKGPLLENAKYLGLHCRRHVSDLIEKDRAMAGGFKLSDPLLVRSGECPLLVAEQFGLEQRLGNGSAVHGHERPVPPTALIVEHLCGKFLPGAALSRDEHRTVGPGNLEQKLPEMKDGGAFAEDPLRSIRLFRFSLKLPHGSEQADTLSRAPDHHAHLVDVRRLAEAVVRACLNGLVRCFARAERGNDDDRCIRVERADLFERLHASHARHLEVQDDDIRPILLYALYRLLTVTRLVAHVPLLVEGLGQEEPHARFIVDDQDSCWFHVFGFSGLSSCGYGYDARSTLIRMVPGAKSKIGR